MYYTCRYVLSWRRPEHPGWTVSGLTSSAWAVTDAALLSAQWGSVWQVQGATSAHWPNLRHKTSAGMPWSPWDRALYISANAREAWRKRRSACASFGVSITVYRVRKKLPVRLEILISSSFMKMMSFAAKHVMRDKSTRLLSVWNESTFWPWDEKLFNRQLLAIENVTLEHHISI